MDTLEKIKELISKLEYESIEREKVYLKDLYWNFITELEFLQDDIHSSNNLNDFNLKSDTPESLTAKEAIHRVKLLISEYENKKNNTERGKRVYKKEYYQFFVQDLKNIENDIYIDYLENIKRIKGETNGNDN